MIKMDCDIIQDLIPSYVDEICSDATRKFVEEHIEECDACKNVVKLYRENELTGKGIEQRQIDGFRKLKVRMKRQNILSIALLFAVACFGLHVFWSNNVDFSMEILYITFIICITATFFIGKGKEPVQKATKKEYYLLLVSVLAIIYPVCMYTWCFWLLLKDVIPFGLKMHQIGPFIHTQWGILFVLQLIVLEEQLRGVLKQKRNCQWMMTVSLTGIFLLLGHAYILGHSTTPDVFLTTNLQLVTSMLLLGLLGILLHLLVRKMKGIPNGGI